MTAAYKHAWYLAHRHVLPVEERRRRRNERARRYRATHREAIREWTRRWFAARGRVSAARYRAEHAEAIAAYNRERAAHYANVRRARELGATGSHSETEWREKIALFGGCCAYCGEAKPLERDHKVPLARGGTDHIDNILPACRSCNARKHMRTPSEFLEVLRAGR